MKPIKFIYFDVANTLLHKPSIWTKMKNVLISYGYTFTEFEIRYRHKLISEVIKFPDKTSRTFYRYFNEELLYALGVSPNDRIVEDIFSACDNLKWEQFEDAREIGNLEVSKGILSNWDASLPEKLSVQFDFRFDQYVVSALEGVSKPDPAIFEIAISKLELGPEEIAFVGDSIKLDIVPAAKMGIQPILMDRDNVYTKFKGLRISSFKDLTKLIK